ncbi:hypothetical protein HQ571_06075 [Candidatus Kuenenbacteria bacterium]|nr:hypothetical protein [Candidatus Kuenenbacteria bacterium]
MLTKLIILIICIGLFLIVWSVFIFGTMVGLIRARGVPFVPLNKKQLSLITKYVKLNPDDKLVDLGCGDGRVLRLFEKQSPAILDGYEVNFWATTLGWIQNLISHSKSKIYYKNFNKIDLSKYNIVFCYLLDTYLLRLRDKFDRELKPGTIIYSYDFEIKDWRRPVEIFKENKSRIFIYKI